MYLPSSKIYFRHFVSCLVSMLFLVSEYLSEFMVFFENFCRMLLKWNLTISTYNKVFSFLTLVNTVVFADAHDIIDMICLKLIVCFVYWICFVYGIIPVLRTDRSECCRKYTQMSILWISFSVFSGHFWQNSDICDNFEVVLGVVYLVQHLCITFAFCNFSYTI